MPQSAIGPVIDVFAPYRAVLDPTTAPAACRGSLSGWLGMLRRRGHRPDTGRSGARGRIEVEAALDQHPAVLESCVVGVPSELGEESKHRAKPRKPDRGHAGRSTPARIP
ncbi:hypothetical protein DPM13_15020 [Paracoccus mutanolyticus]|uniref:Uncharacterized protein n=1 Tax=Paracoccus mutanolyticus TaxID=1499308 RepID=A0ABN5M7I8_9RHOB|nr:hypothetical protein DPM13_15020 [Paracoccus mutanolyticus]